MSESEFDDDLQNELVEIFSEEAEEIFETLIPLLRQWKAGDKSEELLKSIRRSYHTLKGSGRMVGATDLGDVAYVGEQYFEVLSNGSVESDPSHFILVDLLTESLHEMVAAFKERKDNSVDSEALIALMKHAIAGEPVSDFSSGSPVEAYVGESYSVVSDNDDGSSGEDSAFEVDKELLGVFIEEAEEIVPNLQSNLEKWKIGEADEKCYEFLQRAFHTLSGSGRMVSADLLSDFCGKSEQYFAGRVSGFLSHDDSHYALVEEVWSSIKALIEDFSSNKKSNVDVSALMKVMDAVLIGTNVGAGMMLVDIVDEPEISEQISAHQLDDDDAESIDYVSVDIADEPETLSIPEDIVSTLPNYHEIEEIEFVPIQTNSDKEKVVDSTNDLVSNNRSALNFIDDELLEIFVEEANEIFPEMEESLKEWSIGVEKSRNIGILNRCFHTLKGSGLMVGADEISKIATKGERYFNGLMTDVVKPLKSHSALFGDAIDVLKALVHDFSNKVSPSMQTSDLLDKIDAAIIGEFVAENDEPENNEISIIDEGSTNDESGSDVGSDQLDQGSKFSMPDFVDDELIEIFVEEAAETLAALNVCFPKWKRSPSSDTHLAEVRRAFHTLKGSGRLMGAVVISELAWAAENLLNCVFDNTVPASPSVVESVTDTVSYLPSLIESFHNRTAPNIDTRAIQKDLFDLADPEKIELHAKVVDDSSSTSLENDDFENELIFVFLTECKSHLAMVNEFINETDGRHLPVQGDFQRALHTLKGSSSMAGVPSMIEIITPTELLAKDYFNYHLKTNEQFTLLLKEFSELVQTEMDRLANGSPVSENCTDRVQRYLTNLSDHHDYIRRDLVHDVASTSHRGTVEDFMMAVMDPISALEEIVESLQSTDSPKSILIKMKPYFQNIKDASQDDQYEKINNISLGVIEAIDKYSKQLKAIQSTYPSAIEKAYSTLVSLLDFLAMGQPLPNVDSTLASIGRLVSLEDARTAEAPFNEADVSRNGGDRSKELGALPERVVDEDRELVKLFLDESADIMDNIASNLKRWKERPDHAIDVEELLREFHTLKGGARLVKLMPLANLASQIENIYESILDGRYLVSPALFGILDAGHAKLAELIDVVQVDGTLESTESFVDDLRRQLSALSESVQASTSESSAREKSAPDELGIETQVPSIAHADQLSTAPKGSVKSNAVVSTASKNPFEGCDIDDELLVIFMEEAQDLSEAISKALEDWRSSPHNNQEVIQELQRHMHTLKGGARMAGVTPLGDCAHEFEDFVKKAESDEPDEAYFSTVDTYQHALWDRLEQVKAYAKGEFHEVDVEVDAVKEVAVAKAAHNPFERCDIDDELLVIFLEEAQDLSEVISKSLEEWRSSPHNNQAVVQELQRHMHTLKGGARMAGVTPLGDYAHEFEDFVKKAESEEPDEEYFETIDTYQHALLDLLGQVRAYSRGEFNEVDVEVEAVKEVAVAKAVHNPFEGCDIDDELLVIFIEEADELSEAINNALTQWRSSPLKNREVVQELQRHMHTLKGGARMAGVTPLGDCAHEFEDFVKKAESEEPDEAYFKNIDNYQHALADMLAQVKAYSKGEFRATEEGELHEAVSVSDLSISHAGRWVLPEGQGRLPSKDEWKSTQTGPTTGEMVRVAAPLLELLVNLAGETSIIRGRVEQEVTDIGYVLTEMEMTIDRLREQLRRLEQETEAQIRSHHETSGRGNNEDFDPLEMDQYSTINQLTRALSESSSDLSDLKDTLQNKKRDTETLLLQQSRTNSELQESLMKTRMVPFSRLVPRLQRVVRQVASELGKDVEFKVVDSAGEMDRTVMERMVAPLEHMLRNAVDHGMEMPDERVSIGKTRKGRVTLHLTKEGAQAVLRLTDDGRGIDTDRVREKAIEKGMMTPDVHLSEAELVQFIYHSGFSTASSVTQVSGRGVGMDVVNTEIKTLGGSLRVHSTKGVGTQFTTRLPLTVSTTRSLMVKIHDNLYAVPMSQIEGVVRISPFELERYFRDENRLFEYAGVNYHVRYLGYYLSAEMKPVIDPNARPKPAMLVRGADRDTALQVDEVVGSREVVVKSVGAQLASISGLSGATILGDGNVIVILDLHALIRAELAQRSMSMIEAKLRAGQVVNPESQTHVIDRAEFQRAIPIVMVVDDSVTVRKVTSRFLERNGFEVATAKDGVDAVSQLRDVKPDLVLLDIEMPRMDGFEVASFIRHDNSLKHIPIIMITSRTGEKHRERAMSIGVNEYLGKPFQEKNLLEMIHRFVEVQVDE